MDWRFGEVFTLRLVTIMLWVPYLLEKEIRKKVFIGDLKNSQIVICIITTYAPCSYFHQDIQNGKSTLLHLLYTETKTNEVHRVANKEDIENIKNK